MDKFIGRGYGARYLPEDLEEKTTAKQAAVVMGSPRWVQLCLPVCHMESVWLVNEGVEELPPSVHNNGEHRLSTYCVPGTVSGQPPPG